MNPIRIHQIPDPDIEGVKAIVTVSLPQYTCRQCGDTADAVPLMMTPNENAPGEMIADDWDLPLRWQFIRAGQQGGDDFPQKGGVPICGACATKMLATFQSHARKR